MRSSGTALFTSLPVSLLLGAAELLLHTVFISEKLQSVTRFRSLAAHHHPCISVTQQHGYDEETMKHVFTQKTQKLIL